MKFIEIEMDHWARKEHYNHYTNNVNCTFSVTVQIDITSLLSLLKEKGLKSYPVQIYMLSTIVNQLPEFRMDINDKGNVGYWDKVNPMYTTFNSSSNTFSALWTKYDINFGEFYDLFLKESTQYANCDRILFPQSSIPANVFNISSLPWLDFTAFNINISPNKSYLLPIFTIGKYIQENGKTLMPLAIQCHHAACDGWHVGKFVELLRELAITPNRWLQI